MKLLDSNLLYISVSRVLKYDKLMSYDSICYLLLFLRVQVERLRDLMDLLLTTILKVLVGIENCSYIKFLSAARVLVIRTQRTIQRHLHLWLLCVNVAVAHLGNVVVVGAPIALEQVQV